MNKIILLAISLFTATTFAQFNFRSITEPDIRELAAVLSKATNTCPKVDLFTKEAINKTAERIDMQVVKKILVDTLATENIIIKPTPGKTEVLISLKSSTSSSGTKSFEITYTLETIYKQGEKTMCQQSAEIKKSSALK